MSIKTLFLILILHIFHEEEGYQASAELPNFSRFIFYFWEKRHLFKKKLSFYTLTIIRHNPATSFPGQRERVLDKHGVSLTQVSLEYLIIPWIDPLISVASTLVKYPPFISFVYLKSWAEKDHTSPSLLGFHPLLHYFDVRLMFNCFFSDNLMDMFFGLNPGE